jgi:RNA 2',3'-cyclic 3'-phosphodiesterase
MRLFVALTPPPDVRRALSALRGSVDGARWLREGALHVTLRFLGEVSEVQPVMDALAGIVSPPIDVELITRAAFPDRQKARVLVVRGDAAPSLAALQQQVDAAMQPFTTPEHRPFNPHVTLARRGGPRTSDVDQWLARPTPAFRFVAREVVLYESRPGSDYRPIATYPLGSP